MFGAGIGIGMLGYAAGEPLFHFANNPDIIKSKEAIIAALVLAGGLVAIQSAMIIAAIPFTFIMVLMCVALLKALYRDSLREQQGQDNR